MIPAQWGHAKSGNQHRGRGAGLFPVFRRLLLYGLGPGLAVLLKFYFVLVYFDYSDAACDVAFVEYLRTNDSSGPVMAEQYSGNDPIAF